MSTNEKHVQQMSAKTPSFKQVDREIRALNVKEMEQENALLAETQGGRIQRLLKIYRGIKPLLTVVATLPLIPSTWRAALILFNQALEAVAIGAPDVEADFKAGKDL